jgi:hypothetical protein
MSNRRFRRASGLALAAAFVLALGGALVAPGVATAATAAGAPREIEANDRTVPDDSVQETSELSTSGKITQLLGNPGFENGSMSPAPWVSTPGVINNSSGEPSHSGLWKAWLGGYGTVHTDTLYQQVTIPPTATVATLSFWLHIDTAETTITIPYDTLSVQIRDTSNKLLATLATYSNLNASAGFAQKTFNLLAYRGQTIRIYLIVMENATNQTSFVVDDFMLNVQ